MSITITASASGSLTPTPVGPPFPDPKGVTNGDFLINHSVDKNGNLVGITGDGKTEQTNWTFKFASDPNFPRFSTSRPLTSVLLTLTLTPKDYLIRTDAIYIYRANTVPGLGGLGGSIPGSAIGGAPEIQNLPFDSNKPNRYYTIQMELLNRVLAPGYSVPAFSSDAILEVFRNGGGQIAMHYANDAIVSSAQLELTQESPAFQYAAKFVCGKSAGEVVAPGVYFTAVNIHNPTYTAVRFRIKIAVALPGLKPGPVSKFFDAELGPDEALEIDCPDIFKYAETDASFLKGFVVIETDVELDVVAVYTAAGGDEQVETLHTERVPARRLEVGGLPDLIPVPDANGSFCKRKDSTLTVTVKNQGTSGAGPSVTEVDFLAFGKVSMPTPPLGLGASVDILFPIPPGCFNPDCEFRIAVDANNQVNESNEGNNIAKGICIG